MINKRMVFLILISIACLVHATDQIQLDEHMQMIYHQPTIYQNQAAVINDESLALYHLLNIIDQSMPIQNLKTSTPATTIVRTTLPSLNSQFQSHLHSKHHHASPSQQLNQHHYQHYHQTNQQQDQQYRNKYHSKQTSISPLTMNANNNNNFNNYKFQNDRLHHQSNLAGQYTTGFGNKQPPHHQQQQQQYHNNNNYSNNNHQNHQHHQQHNNNSEKLNGALTSSSLSNSKVPHDADSELITANNAPRCDKFTPDICVDDFEYPEQAIIDEIQKKRDVFQLMYSEVKDNEPLVDGIPRDVEESYNYDYYYYGKSNLSQAASQMDPQTGIAPIVALSSRSTQKSVTQPPSSLMTVIGDGNAIDLHGGSSTDISSRADESVDNDDNDGEGNNLSSSALITLASHNRGLQSMSSASNPSLSSSTSPINVDGMDALIGAVTPPQSLLASAGSSPQSQQQPPTSGFICPSEVMYGKPKLAKNKKGLWKVIVNAGEFTQTVRLEKCLLPNKRCNYVSAQNYESRCAQVHSYHRLLVFEKGRGFYIDTFRLPTGCNCHVTRKSPSQAIASVASATSSSQNGNSNSLNDGSLPDRNQSSAGASSITTGNNNRNQAGRATPGTRLRGRLSSESMLSQTLWSILGGSGSSGSMASQESSNNVYQPQSLILEHLSKNPNVAANISESVLGQLIGLSQPLSESGDAGNGAIDYTGRSAC